ncbi:uncharacterized protein BJ171DRAFT_498690 [Polychytrium aggregatum]|uniref:uncharacterized protein n=1 Tax=Polychytrium aggregatum TaxID=110093 RepID=UPI0022FF0F82|nr:uncharacterized protein BJ171DRAFT_498690 [Polychytrium aggregatum]KAI9206104.1 hypothetical protein BJ171DRAFT_498690 [Polychytrium aggregatum]
MVIAKLAAIEQDMDVCRCKGQFRLLRDLAVKYRRKYYPNGSAREYIMLADALMNLLFQSQAPDSTPYDCDFALTPVWSMRLAPKQTDDIANTLQQIKAADGEYYKQAQILLARLDIVHGSPDAALAKLRAVLNAETHSSPTEYGESAKIVAVMGWTLQGVALELKGELNLAIQSYECAAKHLQVKYSVPAASAKTAGRMIEPDECQWTYWLEETLFRQTCLLMKLGDRSTVHIPIRTYVTTLASTSNSFQTARKTKVYRWYLKMMLSAPLTATGSPNLSASRLNAAGDRSTADLQTYANPFSGIPSLAFPCADLPLGIQSEFRSCLTAYEGLLAQLIRFPRGEDMSPEEQERIQRYHECMDWIVMSEMSLPSRQAQSVSRAEECGEIIDSHYRLLEILYQGAKHTFESLRILRYIVHAFASLIVNFPDVIPKHEYEEAEWAVAAYLELYNRKLDDAIQAGQKAHRDEVVEQRRLSQMSAHGAGRPGPDPVHSAPTSGNDASQPSAAHGHMHSRDSLVVRIPCLENEGIVDTIGVLISGVRIILSNLNGDEQKARKAVDYMEQALELLKVHGATLANFDPVLVKVEQYLGITYGEMALEVSDSELRGRCQEKSIEHLSCAVQLNPEQWETRYQLALAYAELGESDLSIEHLQIALTLNPTHASSWNLLALVLSSKKNYLASLRICETGWRQCINSLATRLGTPPEAIDGSGELPLLWDCVSPFEKESLMNLKITQTFLQIGKYGPKSGLEMVQGLLTLYRKLFGNPLSYRAEDLGKPYTAVVESGTNSNVAESARMPNSDPLGRQSVEFLGHGNVYVSNSTGDGPRSNTMAQKSPHSRAPTAVSTLSTTFHRTSPTQHQSFYRFKVFEQQISLWLLVSALYREVQQYDNARGAVAEAEKVAEVLVKIENKVRNGPSARSKAEIIASLSKPNTDSLGVSGRSTLGGFQKRSTQAGDSSASVAAGSPATATASVVSVVGLLQFNMDSTNPVPKWGLTDANIKRILADITFESLVVEYAEYKGKHQPAPGGKYDKYMSPAMKVEAAHQVTRLKVSPSSASIASTVPTTSPTNASSVGELTGADGYSTQSGHSLSAGSPANVILLNQADRNEQIQTSKLEALLADFQANSYLDEHHMATHYYLGLLYLETDNLAFAEHQFLRVVKHSKGRGGSGGQPGMASNYSGVSSVWSHESWRQLGKIFNLTQRHQKAREFILYAARLERACPIRGFECLSRIDN